MASLEIGLYRFMMKPIPAEEVMINVNLFIEG